MNPTQKVPKYKDPVLDSQGKQVGAAVFDPNTGKALQGAETFNLNDGTAITSDMLAPKAPLNLPERPVDTTSTGIVSDATTSAQSFIDKNLATEQLKRDTQETEISKLMKDISGVQAKESTYQEQAGAFANQDAINSIDDSILVKQKALKNKLEEVKKDPFLTQDLYARIANDETRKVASEMADLQISRSLLTRDYDRAVATAERKIQNELAPLKADLEMKKYFYDNNKDYFNTLQSKQLDTLIKTDERKINQEEDRLKQINNLVIEAGKNGADEATLNKIRTAKDVGEATIAMGKYSTDPLERSIKQAQLNKINQDMSIDRQNLALKLREASTASEVPQAELQAVASKDPVSFFADVIKSNKIKGSATLESLLGVIEASKNLAETGKAGGFKGAAPIKLTPGFLKGPQQLATQGQINAINLKVQQWASGAALTEAQTKQVKKFTPDKNDTDKQIKAKLNNLTNFMLSQGKSSLANQGVIIDVPKVDLFEDNTSGNVNDYLDTVTSTLNDTSSLYGGYEL